MAVVAAAAAVAAAAVAAAVGTDRRPGSSPGLRFMRRATILRAAILSPLLAARCAAHPPTVSSDRPSSRALHAALERVTPLASRCLGAGDRVTVEGFFDGPSGRFRVERTGSARAATDAAVRACVALQLEGAAVRPFGAPRAEARWTVADRVSPEVRATLSADASVATAADRAGEIDALAVERRFRAQGRELRGCYEVALRGDPALRGEVRVRFVVNVDGRVTEGDARPSSEGLRAVGHCILGHLRGVLFPRPAEASAVFEFPLRFEPAESARATGSTGSR